MYVSHAWSKVDAWDAATGKKLWSFDPQVPGERAVSACCDVVNRGVAVWGDKLFVGTLDGRLIALDRKTGQEIWSTQTRSEEHTSELQSLMRISYAVFCLKQKKQSTLLSSTYNIN